MATVSVTVTRSKDERSRVNAAALDRVVKHFEDRAKMARALGLSRSYTSLWLEVPHKLVRALSEITGIPPWEVLPDPYPYPSEETHEKAKKRQGRKPASNG